MRLLPLDLILVVMTVKLTLCSSNYTRNQLSHEKERVLNRKDKVNSDCICLKWTDWVNLGSPYSVLDVPHTYASLLSYGKAKAAAENAEICAVPVSSDCRVLERHDEKNDRQLESSYITCPLVRSNTAPIYGEIQIKFLCWDHECPCLQWSKWYNYDGPSEEGDEEILGGNIPKHDWPCPEGSRPLDVECRTASGLLISDTKNKMLQCNLDGFLCLNRLQPKHCTCTDYMVRFLCLAPTSEGSQAEVDTEASPSALLPRINNCEPHGSKKCDFQSTRSLVLDISLRPLLEGDYNTIDFPTPPIAIHGYGRCFVQKTCRPMNLNLMARSFKAKQAREFRNKHQARKVKTGKTFGRQQASRLNGYNAGSPDHRIRYDVGYPDRRYRYDVSYPDRRYRYDVSYPDRRHGYDVGYPDRRYRYDVGYPDRRYRYDVGYPDRRHRYDIRPFTQRRHYDKGFPELRHRGDNRTRKNRYDDYADHINRYGDPHQDRKQTYRKDDDAQVQQRRRVLDISVRPPVPGDYNHDEFPSIPTLHGYGRCYVPMHCTGMNLREMAREHNIARARAARKMQTGGNIMKSVDTESIIVDILSNNLDVDKVSKPGKKTNSTTIGDEGTTEKDKNENVHKDVHSSPIIMGEIEEEIIPYKGENRGKTDNDATDIIGEGIIRNVGQDGENTKGDRQVVDGTKDLDVEDEVLQYKGQEGGGDDDDEVENDGIIRNRGQDGGNDDSDGQVDDGRKDLAVNETIQYKGQDGEDGDKIENDGVIHNKGEDGGNSENADNDFAIVSYKDSESEKLVPGASDVGVKRTGDGIIRNRGQDGGNNDGDEQVDDEILMRNTNENDDVKIRNDGIIRYKGQDGGNAEEAAALVYDKGRDGGKYISSVSKADVQSTGDGIWIKDTKDGVNANAKKDADGIIRYKGQDGGNDDETDNLGIIRYKGQDGENAENSEGEAAKVRYEERDGEKYSSRASSQSDEIIGDSVISNRGQDGENENAEGADVEDIIRYKAQDGENMDGIIRYKGQDGGIAETLNSQDLHHAERSGRKSNHESQDESNPVVYYVRPDGNYLKDQENGYDMEVGQHPENADDYYYSEHTDEPDFEEQSQNGEDSYTEGPDTKFYGTSIDDQHSEANTPKDEDERHIPEVNSEEIHFTKVHNNEDSGVTEHVESYGQELYDGGMTKKYADDQKKHDHQATETPLPNYDHHVLVADLDYGYQSKERLEAKAKQKQDEESKTKETPKPLQAIDHQTAEIPLPNYDHHVIVADLDYGYQSKKKLAAKAKQKEEDEKRKLEEKPRVTGVQYPETMEPATENKRKVGEQHSKRKGGMRPILQHHHQPNFAKEAEFQSSDKYYQQDSRLKEYNNSRSLNLSPKPLSSIYGDKFPTGYGPEQENVHSRKLDRDHYGPWNVYHSTIRNYSNGEFAKRTPPRNFNITNGDDNHRELPIKKRMKRY